MRTTSRSGGTKRADGSGASNGPPTEGGEVMNQDPNGDALARFSGEKYLNMETFRKNGEGVRTPMWFAEEGGVLYARTFEKTGKVKRLRREPHVRVVPSDARGTPEGNWVDAEALIVEAGSDEAKRANRLLNQRYGLTKRLIEPLFGLRYGKVVTVAIRV